LLRVWQTERFYTQFFESAAMADTQTTAPAAKADASKNATIPTAVVKRIMTEAGCQRISPDAAEELGRVLVEHGKKLGAAAAATAQHAGRTTIKKEDVALASQ